MLVRNLKIYRDNLKALKNRVNKVTDTYEEGVFSLNQFTARKNTYDTKILDTNILINNLESQIKNIKSISSKKTLEGLKLKENLTFNYKRKILHKYFKKIKNEYLDEFYCIEANFNINVFYDLIQVLVLPDSKH
jgi:hypothetical protein